MVTGKAPNRGAKCSSNSNARDSPAPKLAIGDGSLGFWIALQEEYGQIAHKRTWVDKTANILDKMPNILDKMPKSVQGKAKQLIHEMYLAPTRKAWQETPP